jgi:hypothetical protein
MRYKQFIQPVDDGSEFIVSTVDDIRHSRTGKAIIYNVLPSGKIPITSDMDVPAYCLENMSNRKYPDKIKANESWAVDINCYKLDDGIFFDDNMDEGERYFLYIPETHPLFNLDYFDLPERIDKLVPDYTTAKIVNQLYTNNVDPIVTKMVKAVESVYGRGSYTGYNH